MLKFPKKVFLKKIKCLNKYCGQWMKPTSCLTNIELTYKKCW